jgi:pimeloyl-ACP methyl ester carboxylesterase
VKLRRSRLWTSLAVLGSIALGALTRPALLRMGQNLPRFVYLCAPLPAGAYDALAAHPGWAKSSVSVAEGVSLNGLVRRPTRQDAPWVLFFPGNDASQLTAGQKLLERVGNGRDYGLGVYSYRGFDSSDGKPGPETMREDGYRVLDDLLVHERLDASRVHVVAFSMGAYVASAAVGRAAREHRTVASLSLLAPVERMEMIRSVWQGRVSMGDIIDTRPLLGALPGPVLVLHGASDATLDVSQGRSIATALGSRAQFRELPGVGHLDINESQDAIDAVRAMIEGKGVGSGGQP